METLPPPPRLHPERLWSLDALRGVCALVVFLSHWHLWAHIAPRTGWERTLRGSGEFLHDWFSFLFWPQGGHHPAVIGFFVLSGFCIHYPFSRRALATPPIPPDWPGYFRRRFLRIMPVYWTACLLGFAFVAAQQLRPSADPLLILHAHTSWAEALLRLSGLAGVFPKEIFAGNYLLNTVAVEIVMYALYPLIYLAQLRSGWRSVGLAFLAFHLAAVWLLRFVTPYWVFNSVFMLGLFWYFGAFAAHLFNRGIGREIRLPVVLALWVGFLVVKHLPPFYGLNLLKQAAWAGVCMIGILWAVSAEQRATTDAADRPLWRALRFVGKLSYSLYAVHTPAIMFATWALLQTSFGTSYLAQLSATMVLSVATTVAVYLGVERICYQPRAR